MKSMNIIFMASLVLFMWVCFAGAAKSTRFLTGIHLYLQVFTFVAVFAGGDACISAKETGEIGRVFKAQVVADFRHRCGGIGQQPAGFLHQTVHDQPF